MTSPLSGGSLRSRILVLGAMALAIAVFGGLCARVAVSPHYGKVALEVLLGVPILVGVARRPAIAVALLLVVDASVFAYGVLPRVNLPGHPPINVADILLAAAVGGTLWRRPWRDWPLPVRRYGVALAGLLILALVATVKTALVGHSQSRDALYEYRNWLYLAVAFTIALELRGQLWLRFLNLCIALAAGISIIAIAAAASPAIAHELQRLAPTTVYSPTAVTLSGGVALGHTARIRVQGLFFIYSMLIPTLGLLLVCRDRWRLARLLGLLLMLGAIGVSLNRNMYAGALVGTVVMGLLAGRMVRFRLALVSLVLLVSVSLVVLTSVTPAITSQVGKRAGTIIAPSQVLNSASIQDRAYELSYALPSIARHPLTGVGPRQGYGALASTPTGSVTPTDTPRFFVQNLYIDLATDYGIPTAIAFLLIPGVCLGFGVKCALRARSHFDRAILASGIGSLVGLLLSCLVDTFVQDPPSTVAFGLVCGIVLAAGLRTLSKESNVGEANV